MAGRKAAWYSATVTGFALYDSEPPSHQRQQRQRRKRMRQKKWYSPQIRRDLVRELYFAAKAQRIAMTTLANRIIESGLTSANAPDHVHTPEMQKNTHTTTILP